MAIRHSDRVIAVCQALVDKANSYKSGTPVDLLTDTVLEIENDTGESAEDLKSLIEKDHKLVLYIGNLEHYQGVDMVIEAMVNVSDNITFMIIGGIQADIERCQKLSETLGVDRQVMFLGPRPVQLLQDYLRQADCLISPREKGVNTPMKIYSYLAAGVPVIATNIPSHTQILDNNNSCLVEPEPVSIADGINKVLSNQFYANQLAEKARQDAEESYSYKTFKDNLIEIYNKLENSDNG